MGEEGDPAAAKLGLDGLYVGDLSRSVSLGLSRRRAGLTRVSSQQESLARMRARTAVVRLASSHRSSHNN